MEASECGELIESLEISSMNERPKLVYAYSFDSFLPGAGPRILLWPRAYSDSVPLLDISTHHRFHLLPQHEEGKGFGAWLDCFLPNCVHVLHVHISGDFAYIQSLLRPAYKYTTMRPKR